MTLLYVGIGGALGAMLRYLTVTAVSAPFGTMVVNGVGSFAMGLAFVWLHTKAGPVWQPLVMTGVLGGFTTFSAYSLDALRLYENGQWSAALAYVCGTVVLCLLAVAAGVFVARSLT